MPAPSLARVVVAFALLSSVLAATAPAQDKVPPPQKGPRCVTVADIEISGAPLAVAIFLGGTVNEPEAGHEYLLRYQLRLHTKRGETGPLVGNAAQPGGVVFELGPLAPLPKLAAIRLWRQIDLSRKDLSLLTFPKDASDLVVRVEPQIYDATAKTYLTPPRPRAELLLLSIDKQGQVVGILPFIDLFKTCSLETAKRRVALMGDVDLWDADGDQSGDTQNKRRDAWKGALHPDREDPEVRAHLIRSIPLALVWGKSEFPGRFSELKDKDDPLVKAAIAAKMAEVREFEQRMSDPPANP